MEHKNTKKCSTGQKKGRFLKGSFDLELIKVIIVSVVIVAFIKLFLIQPFLVHGQSMEPNFYENERLIVDEVSYRFKDPERGEVIVFKNPNNTKEYYIKRIIGLPKETISIKNGRVAIYNKDHSDGFELDEKYLPNSLYTSGDIFATLGEDEFFVLGDNRPRSSDSRNWGILDRDLFIGRVWVIFWPFNKIGIIKSPSY